jgi:hypothetical protein
VLVRRIRLRNQLPLAIKNVRSVAAKVPTCPYMVRIRTVRIMEGLSVSGPYEAFNS